MGFYNLNPDKIRELQSPGPGTLLARDGSNIASVYETLQRDNPGGRDRVIEYLEQVVPGVGGVDTKILVLNKPWSSGRRFKAHKIHGDFLRRICRMER